MAELINRNDSLNDGRKKLNEAIKDSNQAKEDAIKSLARSLTAEQIAQLAELKADDTQQQLDNIIIESGTSDAETIQARGNYPLLKDRLNSTDSQLAQKAEQIGEVTSNPNNYSGAIVTIIDDDAKTEFRTVWQPILNATGAKITIAAITAWVGTNGYLPVGELKTLQEQGHEIVSHTAHHQATADISVASAEAEYSQSKQWLIDNGFKGHETLVYPAGLHTNRIEIKDVARKYYKHAVATNYESGAINGTFDSWRVPRIEGDTSTLAQLKTVVDKAILNNSWVVIMTHAHVVESQKMLDFITYVQGLNVPIMPFGEASKYKGNVVAIGEYTDKASTFISATGASKLGSGLIAENGRSDELIRPISDYARNAKTVHLINHVWDTFQSKGGIYEVYRGHDDNYSYAVFRTHDSNRIYQRKWNDPEKKWMPFEELARQTYDVGHWTPRLEGATVKGSHTYHTQLGTYTKFANMVVLRFNIRINDGMLDSSMSGNLNITGSPFPSADHAANNSYAKLEYNILNLGEGYTEVVIKNSYSNLALLRQGNGVATTFVRADNIPSGVVVLKGQITFQI